MYATSQTAHPHQAYLSPPTPIAKLVRNLLDHSSATHTAGTETSSTQPPPSPTLTAHPSGSIQCVNDAVRKFPQFQTTTNITAVVTTFITAVSSSGEQGVSAVRLLWISLIMDTFAALALATGPTLEVLLNRKAEKTTDPLFTVDMLKQILGQSAYQIVVIVIFHFLSSRFHLDDSTQQKHSVIQTLVFNAFVFAQIFNSLNCHRRDRNLNISEGVFKNWYFLAITFIGSSLLFLFVSCLNLFKQSLLPKS